MKQQITKARWEQAQQGEKAFHEMEPVEMSYAHYETAYQHYFNRLDINQDLAGKSVIEIGPGRISGLLFCENYSKSYILEPTIYNGIDHLYAGKNLEIVRELAEDWSFPRVDEIWILNLMQHVKDPDLLINKCKTAAHTIRFFEPVDLPTDNEHPFSFSMDDFVGYFGQCVKEYPANQGITGFHGARCAYGVWQKS